MDYAQFGDVVTFDTTYKLNKEHRPFASFVGFNHHRETIIFGVDLLNSYAVVICSAGGSDIAGFGMLLLELLVAGSGSGSGSGTWVSRNMLVPYS
ncbi:hypothetical protein ACSBR2_007221 [Camellia fascicularis]